MIFQVEMFFSSCTFLIHSFCSNFKQSKTLRLASCWIVQSLVRSFRILRSKIFEVMGLLQSRKKIMVFSITPKEQMKLTSEENAQDSEFRYVFMANITKIRIHPILWKITKSVFYWVNHKYIVNFRSFLLQEPQISIVFHSLVAFYLQWQR